MGGMEEVERGGRGPVENARRDGSPLAIEGLLRRLPQSAATRCFPGASRLAKTVRGAFAPKNVMGT
eukprot:6292095-Pyramimonas_sp.AAC.1